MAELCQDLVSSNSMNVDEMEHFIEGDRDWYINPNEWSNKY